MMNWANTIEPKAAAAAAAVVVLLGERTKIRFDQPFFPFDTTKANNYFFVFGNDCIG